jgi:TolB protein
MLSLAAATAALVLAQPASDQPESDPAAESRYLSDIRQLTFAEDWAKAGESYFSPDGKAIVFQAVPAPEEGEEPSPHYGMYAAKMIRHRMLDMVSLVSEPGSANTCGWFHPTQLPRGSYDLMFGSTLVAPNQENQPGYQRGTGQYRWAFPTEMEIVSLRIGELHWDGRHASGSYYEAIDPHLVFEKPGYTAECSYSPDARHILYAQVDEEKSNELGAPDADLWVFDTETDKHTILVEADGYDGGPFFSPDGKWICYRSDRKGNNLLQLFVSELEYDESGKITGISKEIQLTDNRHVNWAPYWHPSGEYMLYASSEVSHGNYEVFAIRFDAENPEKKQTPTRITFAKGFDGLPVFSSDGEMMMWTAQRGDDRSPDGKASSQLWVAKWNGLDGE